jgi:hypothetical protein
MVKHNDSDSSEDDEDMLSEQEAGATSTVPTSFADLMARDTASKMAGDAINANDSQILNLEGKGREEKEAFLEDWTLGDENQDRDQEEEFLLPPSQNFRPGSIDHLDEQMRHNDLRWRHKLKKRVANNPNLQAVLNWIKHHPASMEKPTRTLAEMASGIADLPLHEAERLMDMGDGNMLMPIAMFERYVYRMSYPQEE